MFKRLDDPNVLLVARVLRWSLMVAAIFWVVVYRVDSQVSSLPDFVYVNF